MKTCNNTRYARIVEGTRYDGDDTFWVVEPNCEDLGPFDSREAAKEFLAWLLGQGEEEA